jgi:hypothetical protein
MIHATVASDLSNTLGSNCELSPFNQRLQRG